MTYVLAEDQATSIEKVRELIRQKCRAILLQGATGSGKSVMAGYMIQKLDEKKISFWFLVPRRDLIEQMRGTFFDFGVIPSYIAAGKNYNPNASGFICSTDTVTSRLDKLVPPRYAFIDETHFGGAGMDAIIEWLKKPHVHPITGEVYYTIIIGLSATPWKSSGRGLGCWYDEMVIGPSIRWLINNRRLSDYRPFAPSKIDLSQIDIVGGDYHKGQIADKMEKDKVLIGNAVKHYREHAMGLLGVNFSVSIKHSEITAEEYRNQGIPAAHVDGNTPEDQRRKIFIAFARRELWVLSCAELLTFGFDISSASGIKNVCVQVMTDQAPTKSIAKQMQKWGRNLRYEGLNAAPHLFFDHANNFDEHGLPCDEREWTLSDRIQRKRQSGDRLIPVKTCHNCALSHKPAPVCPGCGYEYPIESRSIKEIDAELKEIEIKERAHSLVIEGQRKAKVKMKLHEAKTVDDLREIMKENKYHWKWLARTEARLRASGQITGPG